MAAAPALLSTELDVWRLAPGTCTAKNETKADLYWYPAQGAVREFIRLTDGKLRAFLKRFYGTDLTGTPLAGYPMGPPADSLANATAGKERLRLKAATAGASAVTEMWEIEFTTATAFEVYGSVTGECDTAIGSMGSDYTGAVGSTTYITVASADWKGTGAEYDRICFSVHANDTYLAAISAKLAASNMLRSVFGDQAPNESDLASQYLEQALASLRQLIDPEGGIELVGKTKISRDTNPIQLDLQVDEFGHVVTDVADFEWAPAVEGTTEAGGDVWV